MTFLLFSSYDSVVFLPSWLVIILFGVPFVGGLTLYIYKTRHARSWRKGIFPQTLKPTEDNFLEAYLSLGAKLILLDRHELKSKTQFINAYFHRYFTKANYNFSDSLLFSLKHPIQIKSITSWLKVHLRDEGSLSQVVFFLAGLAFVNGEPGRNELQFLLQINEELGLEDENLRRILAIYQSYKSQKKEENNPQQTAKQHSHVILGVSANATPEEIKSAYRKLVKLHHPDKFATGTESQQKMAAEKFREIQNAYEDLMEK